jgi:hypothetical protein
MIEIDILFAISGALNKKILISQIKNRSDDVITDSNATVPIQNRHANHAKPGWTWGE